MPQDDTFLSHLLELRTRLLKCFFIFGVAFCVSYIFSQELFLYLLKPYEKVMSLKHSLESHRLIYTGVTEAFLVYIKVSLFSALFFTFPYFAYHVWMFMAPGLYKHEKKIVVPILASTPLLFLMGALFAYYIVFPLAYEFFLAFEVSQPQGLDIHMETRMSEYLSFVMRLIFAFGLSFELPLLIVILGLLGHLKVEDLKKSWRYVVVGIFTLSAILTPPDILSMIALAIPLIVLYAISIILVYFITKTDS